MTALTAGLISTPGDLEALRRLRNECRAFMTGHTDEIGREQQAAWWASLRPEDWRIWLYWAGRRPVAFGLLRRQHGRWWATLGVTEAERGRGIGTSIYADLIRWADGPVWIAVRRDNPASRRAAEKAGFSPVEQDGAGYAVGQAVDILCARKETA